jgi:hypothetical protein
MKNINTKIILMTTVLSAILLQSCTSLNEAAGSHTLRSFSTWQILDQVNQHQ